MTDRTSSETETLKRNEVLAFDDGLLTVKMSGHGKADGWATLAFNQEQFELDDEGYQIVEIPPSELFELRDFLNRVLPADRPGDQKSDHAPCPDQWQPIETAPKSKTVILFAVTDIAEDGRIRNWMMATGWWHPGYENDPKVTPWCWEGHQVPKYGVQPTHWMPLPEAPTVPDTSIGRECACMRGGYPLGNCAECDDPKARDAALSHSSTGGNSQ
jgi:hypothetical protein